MVASAIGETKLDSNPVANSLLVHLLPALHRLDHILDSAMQSCPHDRGSDPSNRFRGLFLTREEVSRLISRDPLVTPFAPAAEFAAEAGGEGLSRKSPLAWLIRTFKLDEFEVDLLVLALAPELDLRYEKIFGFLQDDVTRRRPTIELALNLLCASPVAKMARLSHFSAKGALIRHGLLSIVPDPNQVEPPRLAHYLKLDNQVVELLMGQTSLDSRLAPFCRHLEPGGSLEDVQLRPLLRAGLPSMMCQARQGSKSSRFYIRCQFSSEREELARALCAQVGAQVLVFDVPRALGAGENFDQFVKLFLREALFRGAIPYFDGLDVLLSSERTVQHRSLMAALKENSGITIFGGGAEQWDPLHAGPLGVLEICIGEPDFEARRSHWHSCLAGASGSVSDTDISDVAARFRLRLSQIAEASCAARNLAMLRGAARPRRAEHEEDDGRLALVRADLFAAARAQCGRDLAALARKIEPKYTWDDIVLPENTSAQLREICSRVVYGNQVLGKWGFDAKLSHGKGVNALFAGPSGCGKTMSAEIIANELQLDLYKIDLAGVVSKYIGETEKNLDRIFRAATNANAILFFDEADSLFGKRSEVHDSHDRYANIEVSYLLQKMEEYEGIAILASNLRQHMDEAFIRRLSFTVLFPFPGEDDRRRIWNAIWPVEMPLADSLDFDFLAKRFKLSGGNIRNVALAAAFFAASDGGVITMAHLFHATQREYEKMGKALSEAELYGGYEREKDIRRDRARAH